MNMFSTCNLRYRVNFKKKNGFWLIQLTIVVEVEVCFVFVATDGDRVDVMVVGVNVLHDLTISHELT